MALMDKSQLVIEAKSKYGKVFSVDTNSEEFIFRPLTKKEVSTFSEKAKYQNTAELEEEVILTCVIWPEEINFDEHSAGFVSSLCAEIRECSGYEDTEIFESILETARDNANKVTNLMKAFIIAAMPKFNPSDIEELSLYKTIEYFALAEKILELQASGGAKLVLESEMEEVDPIAAKLQQGMMKAMQETGMNPANLERA